MLRVCEAWVNCLEMARMQWDANSGGWPVLQVTDGGRLVELNYGDGNGRQVVEKMGRETAASVVRERMRDESRKRATMLAWLCCLGP